VWGIANAGFVICCLALIGMARHPNAALFWVMVIAQGTLGYGLTSVMGPIPAEIFAGKQQGGIFGMIMLAAILGGAAGPWAAGALHDLTGSYAASFWISLGFNLLSIVAIWQAAPGKVRAVAGRVRLLAAK
jgi:MFS family permease